MEPGALAIAGIEETGERYLVSLVDDSARGHDPKPHPIVKILQVISYPAQRAIMHPDIPHEMRPLQEGLICRMQIFGKSDHLPFPDYGSSLQAALLSALETAKAPREREILIRHQKGEFHGQRAVFAVKEAAAPWHP